VGNKSDSEVSGGPLVWKAAGWSPSFDCWLYEGRNFFGRVFFFSYFVTAISPATEESTHQNSSGYSHC